MTGGRCQPPTTGAAASTAPRSTAGAVVRNASVLAGATFVARLSGFGLAIVMGRELGPDVYGKYGFAFALGTILVPLADFGLTQYLSREAARARLEADAAAPRILKAKFVSSGAIWAVTAAVVLLIVDDSLLRAAIVILLLGLLSEGLSNLVFGYFQGREQMSFEAWATATIAIVRSVGGAALVLVTGELMPALFWLLAVNLGQMVYAIKRFRAALSETAGNRPASGAALIHWPTVGAMGLITIFVLVYLRADAVLIGLLRNDFDVGLYTAAYTVLLGLQIVPWTIAVALTPVFARSHARQQELFRASWAHGIKVILLVSLPLAVATSIHAEGVVERFFGLGYSRAAHSLAILVWSSPLAALNVVMAGVLRGAGYEGWLTLWSGVGAALNIASNVWAIQVVGIEGAAGVTIVTEAVIILGLASLAVARGITSVPRLPIGRMVVALFGLAAAVTLPVPLEPAVLAGLLVYIGILLVLGVVRRDDFAVLREALSRRPPAHSHGSSPTSGAE